MTLTNLPTLFVPDIPTIGKGLFILPFVGFSCLAIAFAFYLVIFPRAHSLVVFFLSALIAVIVASGPWWWDLELPALLGMTIGTVAGSIELVVRRIWHQLAAVGFALITCSCYYLYLLCFLACAAV